METQKDALKDGRLDAVLGALAGRCEPPEVDDEHAPARTCHRYLSARADQLNYRQAWPKDCRSGRARSKAPTATSLSNA